MSAEPRSEVPEPTEESELEIKLPYSSTLATLGRKMRTYGNTMLVLMILVFIVSVFVFTIVWRPILAALITIALLKIAEIIFYGDFLSSLKESENTYGGHYLNTSFYIFLGQLGLMLIILIVGSILSGINMEVLDQTYASSEFRLQKIFYFYTLLTETNPWLKILEIGIPILNMIGSFMLTKWGDLCKRKVIGKAGSMHHSGVFVIRYPEIS